MLSILNVWLFVLVSFALCLGIAIFRGRQMLINLMIGSYLALLLYANFPYREWVTKQAYGEKAENILLIAVFIVFTLLSTWLFSRLMPTPFLEGPFESFFKKVLLAVGATLIILNLSIHYLPVTNFIDISAPLPPILLEDKFAFLWLMAPLILLFLV